jgi:hypothetical protein
MKEYTIKIDEERKYISSTEELVSELGIVLQVYQDLTVLDREKGKLHTEDRVIKDILYKILSQEFGDLGVPIPEYYKADD